MSNRGADRGRRARFALACMAAVALGAAGLASSSAEATAASSGSVYAGPSPTVLTNTPDIVPGDWLSLGWAVQMPNGGHPAAQIDISSVTVTLPLACSAKGSFTTTSWTFPTQSVTVPAGDKTWYPTGANNQQAAYQLHARAPDLCGGHPMYIGKGPSAGAAFSGSLYSNDTADQVMVQFHSADVYSTKTKPASNLDCSSSQNPGDGTCAAQWSPPSNQTTAQPLSAQPAPPPSPSGSGGSGGTSGGSSGGSSGGGSSGSSGTLPVVGGGPLPVSIAGGQSPNGVSTSPPSAAPTPKVIAVAPAPKQISPAAPNLVLGPVPVLAPIVGDAIARVEAAVPWNWFLVLAGIDVALIVVVALRRRAHRAAE